MPRFDRYFLAQLMLFFGFFALVLVSVYWVNRGVSLFEQLIGGGQSAMVFVEFAALTLPNVIRLVLPIAAFAGTVHVVNRMISESELVVMQALGCSPWRLARPVLAFGLIVALPMAVLTHVLVPASRAILDDRRDEISRDVAAQFLSEGQFLHPARGITFYIRAITDEGELHDVLLSDARNPATRVTYTAKRALLVKGETGLSLLMFDGMAQSLDSSDRRLATARFSDFAFDIDALIDTARIRPPKLDTLSTPALLNPTEALMAATGEPRAAFLYEAHARSAQALLAVAGALIGYGALLVGGFSRFGVGRQVLMAVVLLIGVNLLNNAAADLARRDAALWPVTYLPAIAGAGIGAVLIWASARERRVPARAMTATDGEGVGP